jgi:copper(I)-binding protein
VNQENWESTVGIPVSLSIKNEGEVEDRLLGASSSIARCVGIHHTRLIGGQPQTERLFTGLIVPAGTTITLEPGKSHLTLFGLRSDLVQGKTFPLTLYFDRAGEVTLIARVRRKVDAAGTATLPPVSVGDLTVTGVSAPPAAAAKP